MDKIINRIKEYEGFSLKPYKCTAGKWTVGYGYNYQDRGFTTETATEILEKGFTKELADRLIAEDVARCVTEALTFPFFAQMNEARQAVIVDMIYQLGIKGFKDFKKTIEWLSKGNYRGASQEMVKSKWFTQSGRRSRTNVKQMDTGVWQEIA